MAIEIPFSNPHTGQTIPNAYAFAALTSFDHKSNQANIVYNIHPSKLDAYEGRPPLGSISIPIGPSEFGPLVMENFDAFVSLAVVVDTFALTKPEFSEGQRVTELG